MATIPLDIIRQAQSDVGGTPSPRSYAEGATQTFVKGEVVFLSSGLLTEIASDLPAAIQGVAGFDASNDAVAATSEMSVFLAHPTNIFEGNLTASGAAHVLVQADIGASYGIHRNTTDGEVYLDADDTGVNARVFVHGVGRGSSLGDTNARVLFSFLSEFVPFA